MLQKRDSFTGRFPAGTDVQQGPRLMCQISSCSDNPFTRYLLPKFVDYVDSVTDKTVIKRHVAAYHAATITVNKSSPVAEMGDSFAAIHTGRKVGALVPLYAGELGPI